MYLMNSAREYFAIELEGVFNEYEKTKNKSDLNRRVNFYNVMGKIVKSINEQYLLEVEQINLDTIQIKITCVNYLC